MPHPVDLAHGYFSSRSIKFVIAAAASLVAASVLAIYVKSGSTQSEDSRKKSRQTSEEETSNKSAESRPKEMENSQAGQSAAVEQVKRPSWSELVEDDERQISSDSKVSTKLTESESSTSGCAPSSGGGGDGDALGDEKSGRRSHDSGVASPHQNCKGAPASSRVKSPASASAASTKGGNPAASGKKRMKGGDSPDGGLGSSVCDDDANAHDNDAAVHAPDDAKSKSTHHQNGSDSGQGSEADDGIRMAFHFYIPSIHCGKLIGYGGVNVKQLKLETRCSVQLRELDGNGFFKPFRIGRGRSTEESDSNVNQVCVIEGTRSCIDHCLDLLRNMFPISEFSDITLEQINLPSIWPDQLWCPDDQGGGNYVGHRQDVTQPLQLGLTQGVMHDVFVSNIVCAGHVFLKQPDHPTHASLQRLEMCMGNAYTKLPCPDVPREVIEPGLVCVVECDKLWYRVQVVTHDTTTDTCDVKFVDYGGFFNFPVSDLKQIRSDFLTLPFQALECYLGNVVPPDNSMEWPLESGLVLSEMVSGQMISGRMLGVNEEMVPIVHLYGWVSVPSADGSNDTNAHEQQPRLLNRELVDRGVAQWTEHVMAS